MTEYNAGDLVEAVKGESVICGRLKTDELGLHLWVGDSGRTPENLESYGFTLSIIEKAAAVVVLPTEPGLYQGADQKIWRKSTIGNWWITENSALPLTIWEAELLIVPPLTRLEPVSETAKKVLDRVRAEVTLSTTEGFDGSRTRIRIRATLSDIAAEFGVTA